MILFVHSFRSGNQVEIYNATLEVDINFNHTDVCSPQNDDFTSMTTLFNSRRSGLKLGSIFHTALLFINPRI